MDISIPYDEQETVIILTPSRVSKTADVYTCMPDQANKLRRLARERPDAVRIDSDMGNAVMATVSRECIRIAPKRKLTEEQRAAASERLMKARNKLT